MTTSRVGSGARIQRKVGKGIVTLLLSLYGVVAIYPLLYMFLSSLKTRLGYAKNRFGLPAPLTLENFTNVLNRFDFLRLLSNSFITTVGGVLLCTIVSLFMAYALSKMSFKGSKYIFLLVVVTLMIPNQTIMYPLYQTIGELKLIGQYYGLILVYAAFGLPLGTYLIAAYLRGVPDDLLEASRIDGANPFQILMRVVLPVSMPAIVTVFIINAVWMWNDLLLPLLILTQQKRTTIMVAI
jgi:ABC-type glycerol-3-phosphate transport system permease component